MGHQINATFEEVPLNAISIIRSTIGLPLTGVINGDLNVFVGQASELLDGQINLKVNRTALGPGQLPPDVGMGFKLENVVRGNSQLAFITGPSKSADIELNLTLGVHGPRDVHAIVFDDGD